MAAMAEPGDPGRPAELDLHGLLELERRSWLRGEPLLVEELLARAPHVAADAEAVLDLIYGEARLRLERGEPSPFENLARRFPGHSAAVRDLAQVHFAVEGQAQLTQAPRILGGKYEVLAELGRGGQAVVYRARDQVLGREVAVKVLESVDFVPGDSSERLLREARALAAVDDPHVVRVHEALQEGSQLLVILELVRGRDLARWLREAGPLPSPWAVEVARQMALALSRLHEHGIVHRDVKPQNILVEARDLASVPWARLSDLGLARQIHPAGAPALTGDQSILGTIDYVAPEQARDPRTAGPPADVFSLGCILFECLAGKLPFTGETPAARLLARMSSAPPIQKALPKAHPMLIAAVESALRLDPSKRATARGLAEALRPFAQARSELEPWLSGAPASIVTYDSIPPAGAGGGDAGETLAWDSVDPDQRSALERLSAIHGSFSLAFGERLLERTLRVEQPRDLLASLLERGLVERCSSSTPDVRLHLPGPVENAARASLEARGLLSETRQVHLELCLALANARRAVDEDMQNIGAAIAWAEKQGNRDAAVELALCRASVALESGRAREGRVLLKRTLRRSALGKAAKLPDDLGLRALIALSGLALAERSWYDAYHHGVLAQGKKDRLETRPWLAAGRVHAALALRHLPELGDAETFARSALEILPWPSDPVLLAAAHEALGRVLFDRSRLEEADEALSTAEDLLRRGPRSEMLCRTLLLRSEIAHVRGSYELAGALADEVHRLAEQERSELLSSHALLQLGAISYDRGCAAEAGELFARALERFQALGCLPGIAVAFNNLASTALAEGHPVKAGGCLEHALAAWAALREPPSTSLELCQARLDIALGRLEAAAGHVDKAVSSAEKAHLRLDRLGAVEVFVELCLSRGELAESCCLLGAADAERERLKMPRGAYCSARLEAAWGQAQASLGSPTALHARSSGRSMSIEEALAIKSRSPAPRNPAGPG